MVASQNALRPRFGALDQAKERFAKAHPKSKKAFDAAVTVLAGGTTRGVLYVDPFPVFVSGGSGHFVSDLDGHKYWDLAGDSVSGIYGKNNPVIREAIVKSLDSGIQLGLHTVKEAEFAHLIRDRFPSMQLVRFANSGTEAVTHALCTAQRYTGRTKVVVFEGGYHGATLSDHHLGPDARRPNHPTAPVCKVPFDFLVCPYNDLTKTTELVQKWEDEVACILVEPMLGSGGCIPGDTDFLHGLRELATRIGAVLIFDEIVTARLDYNGLQGVHGIVPDMTTLGKFMGGGLAFGAYGGRNEIMSMFDLRRPDAAKIGGTFNNGIMTMASGTAALSSLLTKSAMEKVNALGDTMRTGTNNIFLKLGAPYSITGLGAVNEIHCLLPDNEGKAGLALLYFALLEKNIAIAARGLVTLTLLAEERDVSWFLNDLEEVLKGDYFEVAV